MNPMKSWTNSKLVGILKNFLNSCSSSLQWRRPLVLLLVVISSWNVLLKQLSGVSYEDCQSAVKHSFAGSYWMPRPRSELPVVAEGSVSSMAGSNVVAVMGWRWQWLPVSGHPASRMKFRVPHYWRGHVVAHGYTLSASRRVETSLELPAWRRILTWTGRAAVLRGSRQYRFEAPGPSCSTLEWSGMDAHHPEFKSFPLCPSGGDWQGQ